MTETLERPRLCSIALATFNGSRFLREQLDSLLGQSYGNLEIVVSDDQSADDTPRILNEYSAADPRIRWSPNPAPRGYAKNFERAISGCRGDFIFLCDQDDVWSSDKVRQHVLAYDDPKIAWVYNRVELIDENGRRIGTLEDAAPDYYGEKTITQAAWGSCILGCATSYRAEAVKWTLPIGRHARAHDSWIQLLLHARPHVFLDVQLQFYRMHEANSAGWNQPEGPEHQRQMHDGYVRLLRELSQNPKIPVDRRLFFFGLYLKKALLRQIRQRGRRANQDL